MTVRQGYPAPIAYTYDASEHCPACTAERYGVDEDGWIPEDARDSEGNGVGAVAPWDEGPDRDMSCDTCGVLIREYEPDDDDEPDALPCVECGHLHFLGSDYGYDECLIDGCGCEGQEWARDVRACFPALPHFGTAADVCARARKAWARTAAQLALDL